MKKLFIILFSAIAGVATAQTLNFSNNANMTTARGGFSASSDGTYEYIANGFSASQPYTDYIERYHVGNDTWSTLATSIPTIAKTYGNGIVLAGQLYLYNGITATGKNDKLEIINLTTGNLTVSPNVNPNPVYSAGSALYGDYLLSFGGCVSEWEGIYSNKFYKISPFGEWFPLADMPVALETRGAVIYGNGTNSKLYAFGGYNQQVPVHENFQDAALTGNLALDGWINIATAGTKLFQGKSFSGNKYAQITAFGGDSEPLNEAWLISPNINSSGSENYLSFETKDGFDNGATLQAYLITNWTGNIATSAKTVLSATISTGHLSGYGTDFVNSGKISLTGISGDFRIAFKYSGGNLPAVASTTYQIDNVKVYQEYKSNSVYIYDFASNTWITVSNALPQAVSAHDVVASTDFSDTEVVLTGDYDNQTFLGYYDTVNGDFTTLGQTNMIGRRHHGAAIFADKLYLFGGNTTPQSLSVLNSTQSASLPALSTTDFNGEQQISFYPNPANDKITFNSDLKSVLLFTFEGKNMDVKLRGNEVDLSGLSRGIYLIQGVNQDGSSFSKKLIKN